VQDYTLEIAHAVGIVVPVFTSFIGHKYWSFR
jgi:putative flippase GtrA